MSSRRECEFFLLRYVPDPVRNEFVHVGVILREATESSNPKAGGNGVGNGRGAGFQGRLALKFTSDWRRVRCLDPEADIAMLEGLEAELRRRFAEEPDGNLFHVLEDSFSNSVQMTRGKGYLAESIETGIDELMRLYVEPQRRERVSRLSGRAAIQGQMRSEFELAGVWDLLRKKIRAADYTRPGDPLRIDLGYLAGVQGQGLVRMFQAVSLEPASGIGSAVGVEMAKVLAFSEASLRAGVERMERAGLELTAVVEAVGAQAEADSERMEAYRFAVETMEEHRIRVVTTADLARVAETARLELRV